MDLALLEAVTKQEQSGRKAYFDILEIATRLERNYGHYFKPYTGEQLFFDFSSRAILDFSKNSYHSVTDKDPLKPGEVIHIPVKSQQDITNLDIYDHRDRLVVRGKDTQRLKPEPTDPVRMFEFIEDYVKDYCQSRIPGFEKQGRGLNNIFESYLSPDMLADYELLKKQDPKDAEYFVSEVFYMLDPLMANVREFMGPNKWMIYLARRVAFDLVIDGFVDYRIYIFHERLKQENECQS